jgi:hypothetical protein
MMTRLAKVHGFTNTIVRNGRTVEVRRVDVELHHMETTVDVFWSERRKNSYVLTASDVRAPFITPSGVRVELYAVNSIGEPRWCVMPHSIDAALRYEVEGKLDPTYDCAEQLEAFRHFRLAMDATAWGFR